MQTQVDLRTSDTPEPVTESDALEEVNESLFEIAGYLRSIKNILTFFLVLTILAILAQIFLR